MASSGANGEGAGPPGPPPLQPFGYPGAAAVPGRSRPHGAARLPNGEAAPSASPADSNRLAWAGLKASVRESRRVLSGSAAAQVRTPTQFAFRALGDLLRTRLYFLSSLSSKESTLLYVDVDDSSPATASDSQLPWNSLIESTFQVCPSTGKLSKEEQLLSERKRCVTWGITEYETHRQSGKFVFPAAGSLFGCHDHGAPSGGSGPSGVSGSSAGPLFPYELKSMCQGSRLCASICPANPDLVTFVGGYDLWFSHVTTGEELRLTDSHQDRDSLSDDPFSSGIPSYVMQEEFNRFTGAWWRPVREDDCYSVLYEEVDESEVELLKFPSATPGDVDEMRFPRSGANNARSTLKMVDIFLGEDEKICGVVHKELPLSLEKYFPWMEYVVRVGWTPDGKFIWCQLLDRRQQRLELVLISPDSFVTANNVSFAPTNGSAAPPPPSSAPASSSAPPASQMRFQVVASVTSDTWVSVNDALAFLPSDNPSRVKFLWASEESGFRHLYLVVSQISSLVGGESDEWPFEETSNMARPKVLQKIALTSGQWPVSEQSVWLDQTHGLVYFQAYKDTPLEKHLYAVSMEHPGDVRRLTNLGFSHNVEMNETCSMFVTVFSSIQSLPACRVFRLSHTDATVEGISLTPAGWVVEPKPLDPEYKSPELFSHTIKSGDKLYGMLFKPNQMVPGKKYPVVLSVYGGPEVQLVSNTFKGYRQIRNHLLASQGYCVVCVDSRGSQNRGTAFESHLRLRMGQVEMRDQVEMLLWLAGVTGFLDLERVAVHGWSYGGYLSLMAIAQFPQVFKVAVAGAPVVSWMYYDTGYTERYMDLPRLNPDGYTAGSVLTHITDFPDEPNRLLIVHGLMDENVHFYHHTNKLISQLVKFGKPYQLQIYPTERHSLRNFEASEHYETTLLSFLKLNL